ncbi:hypothetical protein COOONC_15463 [Cooperia oncophora]
MEKLGSELSAIWMSCRSTYTCKSENHKKEKVCCESCRDDRSYLKKAQELLASEKDRLLRLAKERSEQKTRMEDERARLEAELVGLMDFYREQMKEEILARNSLSDMKFSYFAGKRIEQD